MSLMARLYLLIALAVIPAIGLVIYNDYEDLQRLEIEAETQALRAARLLSGEVDRTIESVRGLLNTTAEAPSIQRFLQPDCSEYLVRLARANPNFTTLQYFKPDGIPACGTPSSGIAVSDRPYFRRALSSNAFVVGDYTTGRGSGVPILPFAFPVHADGKTIGILVAGVRLGWLRDYFAKKSGDFPADTAITIIDREGTILVRLPERGREGSKLQRYQQMMNIQPGGGGTLRSAAENTPDRIARFVGYTALPDPSSGLVIAVGIPVVAALAGQHDAIVRHVIMLTIVALLAFLATWFGGHAFILEPIAKLVQGTERWRRGEHGVRVDLKPLNSELGRLGQAFNAMVSDLEASLQHKDVLLKELSHRVMNSLQTLSALFVLQARNVDDPTARVQFSQAVKRIDSLALAYRRMQASKGVEALDFATFLRELCEETHRSIMPQGKVCSVEVDPIMLSPDQAMPLALIVNELLTNAIKHGAHDDAPIAVKLGRSNEGCRLAVRNRGVLPPGYDPGAARGFGMQMVSNLVVQLRGRLQSSTMAQDAAADHPRGR
jgi:two-component sensor histidine kinase